MTTYHNIMLAIFTFIQTLAAVGGETWKKDEAKVLKRITPRGWTYIVFLFFICIVTIHKEIKSARLIKDLDSQNLKIEQQLKYSEASLLIYEKLRATQESLSELLEQNKPLAPRTDPPAEELNQEIKRYQKELVNLHNLSKDLKQKQDIKKIPPDLKNHKYDDDYFETTKPIIEVK